MGASSFIGLRTSVFFSIKPKSSSTLGKPVKNQANSKQHEPMTAQKNKQLIITYEIGYKSGS